MDYSSSKVIKIPSCCCVQDRMQHTQKTTQTTLTSKCIFSLFSLTLSVSSHKVVNDLTCLILCNTCLALKRSLIHTHLICRYQTLIQDGQGARALSTVSSHFSKSYHYSTKIRLCLHRLCHCLICYVYAACE